MKNKKPTKAKDGNGSLNNFFLKKKIDELERTIEEDKETIKETKKKVKAWKAEAQAEAAERKLLEKERDEDTRYSGLKHMIKVLENENATLKVYINDLKEEMWGIGIDQWGQKKDIPPYRRICD